MKISLELHMCFQNSHPPKNILTVKHFLAVLKISLELSRLLELQLWHETQGVGLLVEAMTNTHNRAM